MRLFVAIDLPDNVKNYLYDIQSSMKDTKLAKVKWVSKKNFHITLKFFGDVPDGKLDWLKKSLSKIEFSRFNLRLSKIGFYPGESKINVIWFGVEPKNKVVDLQMLVDQETISIGKFKSGAHITLGRVKQIRDSKSFKKKLSRIKIGDIGFEVDSYALFKSLLAKDGPSYTVLERYKLL